LRNPTSPKEIRVAPAPETVVAMMVVVVVVVG
jgi:hypothetical protein